MDKINNYTPAEKYIRSEIEKTVVTLQNDSGQLDSSYDPYQTISFTRGKQAGLNLALSEVVKYKDQHFKMLEALKKAKREITELYGTISVSKKHYDDMLESDEYKSLEQTIKDCEL